MLVNTTLAEFLRKLSHALEDLTPWCLCLHGRGTLHIISCGTEQNHTVASIARSPVFLVGASTWHGILPSSGARPTFMPSLLGSPTGGSASHQELGG